MQSLHCIQLLALGDHTALLGLARCHLGDYGGRIDRAKALAFLDRAAGTEVDEDARRIRAEHGLGG